MPIILFQDAAKIRFGYENASDTGPGFKENFVQIGVYFQSLNTKKILEEPKYTVSNIDIEKGDVSCSLIENNIYIK